MFDRVCTYIQDCCLVYSNLAQETTISTTNVVILAYLKLTMVVYFTFDQSVLRNFEQLFVFLYISLVMGTKTGCYQPKDSASSWILQGKTKYLGGMISHWIFLDGRMFPENILNLLRPNSHALYEMWVQKTEPGSLENKNILF